jgi:hypothetical protein
VNSIKLNRLNLMQSPSIEMDIKETGWVEMDVAGS